MRVTAAAATSLLAFAVAAGSNPLIPAAPATLILSGDAMQQTPSADGGAGFQGYIDWSATAAYGNAEVTFMTDGLNEVTPARSDRTNADSGTGDGEVRVDVSLQGNARPLLAGHYTGTLTLVLNPLP